MTPDLLLLDDILRQCPADTLWCADENVSGFLPSAFAGQIITNRFDVAGNLQSRYPGTVFNDFRLDALTKPLTHIVFRIAKEKAVNLHLIRQAMQRLPAGGTLHLLGYKNEGMASLVTLLGSDTGATVTTHRHKAQLFHVEATSRGPVTLADDYETLQWLEHDGLGFFSKPGLFGWNKIDQGSKLLMDVFSKHNHKPATSAILDLGCGYGYLSIRARQAGLSTIDATDNNAAALLACQANLRHYGISGDVFADDHASHCRKRFDIILCNPPFHQGFGHQANLTEAFTLEASRLLKPKGQAWFVVNQFIGIEKIASRAYKKCELLDKSGGFKVFLFETE